MSRYLVLLLAIGLPALALPADPATEKEAPAPINLKDLNTDKDEDDPHLATSALQLYYSLNTDGKWSILVSTRRSTLQSWPPGKPPADTLRGKADFRSPFVTTDGRYPQYLYYATNKDPETEKKGDNFDIYFLIRQGPRLEFTAENSVNPVDTKADELHPWLTLTTTGQKLFFSRKDPDGWHVYVSSRPPGGGQFGEPVLVKLPVGFHHATLTPDGKTMYLQGPLEKDRWGLFRTTWENGEWSNPEPLTELNNAEGPTGDMSPSLSRDGLLLYFSSDRPGGKGGLDLWVVKTAELNKKP